MKCNEVEELLIDYLEDTLPDETKQSIASHLKECVSCSHHLQQTSDLLKGVAEIPMELPSPRLSASFENRLQQEISNAKPLARRMQWKTILQIAASAILVLAGYWLGTQHTTADTNQRISDLEAQSIEMKKEITLAMMNNPSASKRIMAVGYSEELDKPDEKVLQAVINRLQVDENINVRLAAADALGKFANEEIVKEALIHALGSEKSPDVQIALINWLAVSRDKRAIAPIQQLINEEDVPSFVKEQANAGLAKIL